MRASLLIACMALLAGFSKQALGQNSQSDTSTQIRKEFGLGKGVVRKLQPTEKSIDDPTIVAYVQAIEDHLARVAGAKPLHERISRGADMYASLLSNGEIYISGALVERLENEAELAGLLAHQIAHEVHSTGCALSSGGVPLKWMDERRQSELEATKTAVNILMAGGYEPSAVLDLLSKLAYEHPAWAKTIDPDDLLNLRVILETEVPPEAGYVIDSSNFILQHAKISKILGHLANKSPALP